MSGHSKWATTKHKKAAVDAKRGQIFTKVIKEITTAAHQGGGNPDANSRLRTAIDRARAANMPKDNIENAIKKGTGELPGVTYEEIIYECFGPQGIAIMIEALTDNKNRSTAEIRTILSRRGGHIGSQGSVSRLFHKKGFFLIDSRVATEEQIMSVVLEAGAEDLTKEDGDIFQVTCAILDFENVKKALQSANIPVLSAEITMLPVATVRIEDKNTASCVLGLMDALEAHEDVQETYANFDIPDSLIKEITGER
ncbi:YebC/PmpR family DNA-binding transcriptional regulator [bacterium Unc6]|nr:YebC/PmpR family DNA-binding transcriptional regulator [bacterium Unc6]